MKRLFISIIIIVFFVCIGFFIGKIFFTRDKDKNETEYIANKNQINNNVLNKQINSSNNKTEIETFFFEPKVSINTKIIETTYYNKCNHQIDYTIKDIEKYVNMTKEDMQKEFKDWEIKEFDSDNVILYKEEDDFCNEHFLVKDEEGFVTIYTIDNEGKVLELLDKTEIATKYLATVDQDNLKKGMTIYTKQNLNKLIEDFE